LLNLLNDGHFFSSLFLVSGVFVSPVFALLFLGDFSLLGSLKFGDGVGEDFFLEGKSSLLLLELGFSFTEGGGDGFSDFT
jgi:hypothetical protein